MKVIRTAIWTLLLGGLILASVLAIFFAQTGHYLLYTISSGSMAPTLPVGSLVINQPQDDYAIGDIISFSLPTQTSGQEIVTHRIYAITFIKGKETFTTKGDHNTSPDINPIYKEQVKGKVIWAWTLVGRIETALHTPVGLSALIVIPATILVYEQIQTIGEELKKKRAKTAKHVQVIRDIHHR